MVSLAEYVDGLMRSQFAWGKRDCCTMIADWIEQRRDVDVMSTFRGRYDDRRSAILLFAPLGGLEDAVAAQMAMHGFRETTTPEDGDVGVVVAPVGLRSGAPVMGPVCSLRYGGRWVVIGMNGISIGDFFMRRAWTVG